MRWAILKVDEMSEDIKSQMKIIRVKKKISHENSNNPIIKENFHTKSQNLIGQLSIINQPIL